MLGQADRILCAKRPFVLDATVMLASGSLSEALRIESLAEYRVVTYRFPSVEFTTAYS